MSNGTTTTSQAKQCERLELEALATQIKEAHEAMNATERTVLENARRCGKLLLSAKAQLSHGAFLPWLREHCRLGERQARNYMRVAEHWSIIAKSAPGSDLTIKQAVKLTQGRELTRGKEPNPPTVLQCVARLKKAAYEIYEKWPAESRKEFPILLADILREYSELVGMSEADIFRYCGTLGAQEVAT